VLTALGNRPPQLTWGKDPLVMAVVLVTAVLKVLGGLFALALVRPWGRVLPRWMLLTIGWDGALLLSLYGGSQVATQVLVAAVLSECRTTSTVGPSTGTSSCGAHGFWCGAS
jgi:hypothetical protein